MAFTVEDGTGLPDANAYASVEFADAYFSERGVTAWTGDDAKKQTAIILATDYIETLPERWGGEPTKPGEQALKFPRDKWAGVPVGVKRACCQYALRSLSAKLLPDPTVDPSGQAITKITKKADVLEKSIEFADPHTSKVQTFRKYPEADSLLVPYIAPRSGGVYR